MSTLKGWTRRLNPFEWRPVEEILPFVTLIFKAKRVRRRLRINTENLVKNHERYKRWLSLQTEMLDRLLEQEKQRTKSIEDKTSKMFAIFAVALTISSTFLGSLATNYGIAWKPIWSGALLASCAYLFVGAWIAFYSMQTRVMYGYGPDWEVLLSSSPAPKRLRVDALARTEIANILLGLFNSAASQCLRNGFALFLLGLWLAAAQPPATGVSDRPFGELVEAASSLASRTWHAVPGADHVTALSCSAIVWIHHKFTETPAKSIPPAGAVR